MKALERNADAFMEKLLRVAMFFAVWPMLYYTATFSAFGLSLDSADPMLYNFGLMIAVVVIILEFAFNRGWAKDNKTVLLFSVFAYIYSISTTFVGIRGPVTLAQIQAAPLLNLVYFLISAGLDILPEVFLVLAVFGRDGLRTGDMVGQLIDLVASLFNALFNRTKTSTSRKATRKKARTYGTSSNTPPKAQSSAAHNLRNKLNKE